MTETRLTQHIEAIRHFNRFYTRKIGVLQARLLQSPFSLTEARIIYEIAHHEQTTATELSQELGLDAGYLSRILRSLQHSGLINKQSATTDARQYLLSLTEAGQTAFAKLNAASHNQIEALMRDLSPEHQHRLVGAMHTIQELLGAQPQTKVPYILRPHQPGDLGWIVHRHAVLYNQQYRWNVEFEALVAQVVTTFIQNYNPQCECCWIAEKDGQNVGSVLLVKKTETTAQLRLLLVEPQVRGLGIGKRLVHECTRFARQSGYSKITLWTVSLLDTARRIYEQAGYQLVAEEPRQSFGHNLTGQHWELNL